MCLWKGSGVPCAQGHHPENRMALDLGPGTTWAHCPPSVCPFVKRGLTYSRGVCEDSLSAVAQHTKAHAVPGAGVGSLSPHSGRPGCPMSGGSTAESCCGSGGTDVALLERAHEGREVQGTTSRPPPSQAPASPSLCARNWMGWPALPALPTARRRLNSRQLFLPSATSRVSWRAQVRGQVTQVTEPQLGVGG